MWAVNSRIVKFELGVVTNWELEIGGSQIPGLHGQLNGTLFQNKIKFKKQGWGLGI